MTTIAANREMMAADGQGTRDSGLIVSTAEPKLQRMPNGDLVGCQGDEDLIVEFEKWYAGGMDPQEMPDFAESNFGALVLTHDRRLLKYHSRLTPVEVRAEYTAIGAGDEIAMGAMAAGASPCKALQIACQLNIFTGPTVVCERLE